MMGVFRIQHIHQPRGFYSIQDLKKKNQVSKGVLGFRNQVAKEVLDTPTNNLNDQLGNLGYLFLQFRAPQRGYYKITIDLQATTIASVLQIFFDPET